MFLSRSPTAISTGLPHTRVGCVMGAGWVRRPHERGFSLIELLVTVAVLGVILAFALPNFADFLQKTQIERYAGELRGAINYAKQQALRTGMRTTVCRRDAGLNLCTTDVAQRWDAGWLVFHDASSAFAAPPATDANNQYDAVANETLLKVNDGVTEFRVQSVGPSAASIQPFLAFTGQGVPANALDFCVKFCAQTSCSSATNNRYLIVTSAGHVRLESEATITSASNAGICS